MIKFLTRFIPPAIVFVIFLLFTLAGGFSFWPWFDNVFHFSGGVAIALTAFLFVRSWDSKQSLGYWPKVFFIVGLAIFAAVAWEWLEFILDITTGSNHQPSIADTMIDLLLGAIGAMLTAVYANKYFNSR